jgi:hypothetical protein
MFVALMDLPRFICILEILSATSGYRTRRILSSIRLPKLADQALRDGLSCHLLQYGRGSQMSALFNNIGGGGDVPGLIELVSGEI